MRGGRASRVIFGAGAVLAAPAAAEASPDTDSPTAAQQRLIREEHLAKQAPQPTPEPAPPRPVAPAPVAAPPPAQPRPVSTSEPEEPSPPPAIQPRPVSTSEPETPAVARPPAQPRPVTTSEPAPVTTPPAQQRGSDGLTPGQRRLIDEDRRATAAAPPPPAPAPTVAPPAPTPTTPQPSPSPSDPADARGPDGLTPGQRRLIEEDRRAAEAQADRPPVDAEVMNWNLGRGKTRNHGEGTDPNEVDEVAETVADELPDIVTLQEVYTDYDAAVSWDGRVRPVPEDDVTKIVRLIEEETGVTYHVARAPATVKHEWDDNIARDNLVGDFGNVVLSREPITDASYEQLPPDGDEGRVTQEVVTTVDGVEVTVVNTHVTYHDEPQPDQLEEAFDRAGRISGPVIFAGDFNATSGVVAPHARDEDLSRMTDRRGPNCATGQTRNAIDHVYSAGGVTGQQRGPGECEPSDHPYQVVDVQITRD